MPYQETIETVTSITGMIFFLLVTFVNLYIINRPFVMINTLRLASSLVQFIDSYDPPLKGLQEDLNFVSPRIGEVYFVFV